MNIYFDTSAIVKLFSVETGTEKVEGLINDPKNKIWLLEMAETELLSAVYRKLRNNEIPQEKTDQIKNEIVRQMERFNMVPFNSAIIRKANHLVADYGLDFGIRTLDALHIGGWLTIADKDWLFVSSDKVQAELVENIGFRVLTV